MTSATASCFRDAGLGGQTTLSNIEHGNVKTTEHIDTWNEDDYLHLTLKIYLIWLDNESYLRVLQILGNKCIRNILGLKSRIM